MSAQQVLRIATSYYLECQEDAEAAANELAEQSQRIGALEQRQEPTRREWPLGIHPAGWLFALAASCFSWWLGHGGPL